MIFEILFVVFLVVCFLCSGVAAVIIIFKEKLEKPNLPILLNFMSYKNNKRFIGVLLSSTKGKEGREIIEYSARDLDESTKPEKHSIIIEPNKKLVFPKGELSNERDIVIVLPHDYNSLNEKFKNTDFGKAIGVLIELKNVENHVIQTMKESNKRKEDLMEEIAGGEISRTWMKKMQEIFQDAIETTLKGKEPKKEEVIGSR